jgi:hypothetical protein
MLHEIISDNAGIRSTRNRNWSFGTVSDICSFHGPKYTVNIAHSFIFFPQQFYCFRKLNLLPVCRIHERRRGQRWCYMPFSQNRGLFHDSRTLSLMTTSWDQLRIDELSPVLAGYINLKSESSFLIHYAITSWSYRLRNVGQSDSQEGKFNGHFPPIHKPSRSGPFSLVPLRRAMVRLW